MTLLLLLLFIAAYLLIAFESVIKINKAAIALITGVLCWLVYIVSSPDKVFISRQLSASVGQLPGILFFLMGAMAIVELIDAHDGFEIITRRINYTSNKKLLWMISLLTFFLSPVLDNLTTAIVMIAITRKFIKEPQERLNFYGMIIIAANAGGVWSPIGDVTTTMLWIGGQITAENIIMYLFLPSLFCLLVPLSIFSFQMKTKELSEEITVEKNDTLLKSDQYLVLFSGFLILISVPVFKTLTGLPPYMGPNQKKRSNRNIIFQNYFSYLFFPHKI